MLLDFGQNLVGWLRFTVEGEEGETVTIRHAEVLEDGELCTRPLRTAQATDRLVLSGGVDEFEPTFTTHGFRYAERHRLARGSDLTRDVEAVVVHSDDAARIGRFTCSDERLDQLHDNAVWSWRGNAVGVPTDCPQRDERLGWTGDLAVFAPSAAYLFDVSGFLREWLTDLAIEQQQADGRVPLVAPDCLKFEPPPGGPAAHRQRGDLGGRGGVGAVGAVGGVRRPDRPGRPVAVDARSRPAGGGPVVGARAVGDRLPVR